MGSGDDQAVTFPGTAGPGQVQPEAVQQQAGNAGQAAASGQATGQPATGETTPGYITEQQLQQKIQEAREAILREVQSRSDKAESRLSKQVSDQVQALDKRIEELKAAGVNVTPAMRQQSVEQIVQRALMEGDSGDGAAQPGQVDLSQPTADAIAFVNRRVQEIFRETGVVIEQGSAEAQTLDYSSPEKFLLSVATKAEELKAARANGSQQSPTQPAEEQGGNPAARLPGLGAGGVRGNQIANITDPKELISMGLKKK